MTERYLVHFGVHYETDFITILTNVTCGSHPVTMQALMSVNYCSENGLFSVAFVANICMALPLFPCH